MKKIVFWKSEDILVSNFVVHTFLIKTAEFPKTENSVSVSRRISNEPTFWNKKQ